MPSFSSSSGSPADSSKGLPLFHIEQKHRCRHPRIIGDLMIPHLLEQERQYEIVKTVVLEKIDYENFITDKLADRQFIEDNAALCSRGEIWKCLLIRQRGKTGSVLVMPASGCYVSWAAGFWG
jgi:hypothetical protein